MFEVFQAGGPVMWPLFILSLVVFTVVVERILFWLLLDFHRDGKVVDKLFELAQHKNWLGIRDLTEGSRDYVIRVLVSGILHRKFSMGRAMEAAAADEIKKMQRFMGILDTMITVAPLMGIFGTVIGIIASFNALGTTGIDHPEAVTGGIAQALITTAAGLGIAIFTVFPFNYFNTRIENAALLIEKYATSLEIVYDKCKTDTDVCESEGA